MMKYSKRMKKTSKVKPIPSAKRNAVLVPKPVINPAIKQYVKKLVKSTEEVKVQTYAIATSSSLLGSGFNLTNNYGFYTPQTIIPVVSQGVGQQQRIGNVIRPIGSRFMIKGYVLALPVNATNNAYQNLPFHVRVCVYRQKQNNNTPNNSGILDSQTTDQGNDFTGSLYDLMTPYNKDKYEIGFSRTFTLQPCSSTGGVTNVDNIGPYPVCRFFKGYIKLPAVLKYNDTNTAPMNSNWFMAAGIVQSDGTLITNSNVRCRITADTIMKYTDA